MIQWAEVINTDLSMVGKAGFLNEGGGHSPKEVPQHSPHHVTQPFDI